MQRRFLSELPGDKWSPWVIFGLIVVGVYILSLLYPGTRPYAAYPLEALGCGRWPVVATRLFGEKTYVAPGMPQYGPSFLMEAYFCNEQQAQEAGYSPEYP